jgi:hypothetical protein
MKAKHVFTTLGLALTMGLGVAAGLSHVREFKQAKADSIERTVYCAIDTTTLGSYTLKLNVQRGTDDWVSSEMTDLNDSTSYPGKKVFYGTFQELWGGVDKMQFQLYDGSTWKEQDEVISSYTAAATYSDKLHVYKGSGWVDYDAPEIVHTYGVIGSFNGWGSDVAMTVDGNNATVDIELAENDEFKIRRDNAWATSYGYSELDTDSLTYFEEGVDGSSNPNGNIVAKASGEYSLKLDISLGKIYVTNFVPETPKYYVKVAAGEYQEMTYVKDFVYDTTKTGHEYELNITATEGQKLSFRRGASTEIKPGASDGNLDNNLFYKNDTQVITVLQDATNKKLTLKVYEDGSDAFLAGYVADPQTYYFTNNKGWVGIPQYYVFNDNNTPLAEFPGSDMTYVDIDGNGQERYKFVVDSVKWPNFIIANKAGTAQTVDYTFAEFMKNGFYLIDPVEPETKYTLGVYDYAAVVRTLTVNGVSKALTESASQPEDPNVLLQLETPVVEMNAGDELVFLVDGAAHAASLEAYGRNNGKVESDKNKVLVNATGKVYVKLMKDSSVKLFVEGIQAVSKGYHVLLNDNQIVELADSGEIPEGYTGQTCSKAITFHKNDKFRLVDTSSDSALPVPFSPAHFDEYSDSRFTFADGYVKYTGESNFEAAVYLKLSPSNDMVYVGGALPEVAAAKAFAIAFNTAFEAICKDTGHDAAYIAQIAAEWQEQKADFAELSSEAQAVLKAATGEHSVVEIGNFIKKYNYIAQQYGEQLGTGWNFLEKNYGSNTINNISGIVTNNNTALVVILVATISVISAAGLFLVIRRRKHN